MALTWEQLESVTNDYFIMDGGKATDIYFNTSFGLNLFLKQQKGIWKRPSGGIRVRIPLKYDGAEADFYVRGDTLSSEKRDNVNAAYFTLAHAYGNATVLRLDTLENSGPQAEIELVYDEIETAQQSCTKKLAQSLYDDHGAGAGRLTGLRAMCSETATTAYGGIIENDLVAQDGTKPWEGKTTTTTESISPTVIRTMASGAKISDGAGGKPNIVLTTEALFNSLVDILTLHQRFVKSEDTAKFGFTGVDFEGKIITPDDYCPSGYAFALNTNFVGFAVHTQGFFMRGPWRVIEDSPEDKTMKIYFDGNLVCSNRKAHIAHSNLS